MPVKLGIWPAKYALGEKLFVVTYKSATYTDSQIESRLTDYANTSSTTVEYQEKAEKFLELLGGSHGGSSALFGPIDTSKENCDRMHMITLAMGADTGKHDHTPNAYNTATVQLYVRQNKDGTYVAVSGGKVSDKERARHYTDRSEAESHCLSGQIIVEG